MIDNKYLYNGKELQDDQVGGVNLDWYDYGERMYDPALGRWHVIDAVAESYYSWSPYNYVRNNPILRIDPNGMWDITVHAYNNREQYGYGVAVVTNRHGNEVARYNVRVVGQHRNRTMESGDTPTGTFDIPDQSMWMSGGSVPSFGPNHRLILNDPDTGEVVVTYLECMEVDKVKMIIKKSRMNPYKQPRDVFECMTTT